MDNWLKLKIRVMKITFGNCDNLSDSFFNSFSKEFQDRETLKLVFLSDKYNFNIQNNVFIQRRNLLTEAPALEH